MYIGIDPGMSGGLVAIDETGKVLSIVNMPSTEHDTWSWFEQVGEHNHIQMACIEKVHSFPGQGVASTFKFGQGYGFLRACLVGNKIPFEEVSPRTWQKALGIPVCKDNETKKDFKNRLKQKAQSLYPDVQVTLSIADALLIATYIYRLNAASFTCQ